MLRFMKVFIAVLVVLVSSSSTVFAITKVAARYNVMELNVSSATAQGSYDRIGIGNYEEDDLKAFSQLYNLEATEPYDNSLTFGINYGRLINDNVLFNVGFSFVDAKIKDDFKAYFTPESAIQELKLRMYNIDFNWNYYLMPPVQNTLAPYAGVGFQAGLLSASLTDFASESDFIIATAFNFGADLKVWNSPDGMGFLSVSSVNSYQFYASESRPKFLTIGLGLKYFMRP